MWSGTSYLRIWAICAFFLILQSCQTQDVLPSLSEVGLEFYPIQSGNTWIYQVDTTAYLSRFNSAQNQIQTDTFRGRYFLKEIISDSIGLQEGNPIFRVEIYRAPDSTGPWKIDSVWSIQRSQSKILKTENNRPIVKLKFPLKEGSRWDGNQYNALQDSSGSSWFNAINLNREIPFRNNFYPSVMIIQKSDSSCLGKTRAIERYMKGIGPDYKYQSGLIYSQDGPDPCGNIPRIESGKEKIFKLLYFEKAP
jgi:hypothetical protein